MTAGTSTSAGFPQDRSCPYHPPAGYRTQDGRGPMARVTLYDGSSAWLVSGLDLGRRLLGDARLSVNRRFGSFPFPSAEFAGSGRRDAPLIGVDGSEHAAQRRMLVAGFTHRRVASLRPRIRQIVDRHVDAMVEKGPGADLVTEFALPVTSIVICGLLGVPDADHGFLERQSRRLLRGPADTDRADGRTRLENHFGELIDRKRSAPGDGLLDDLIQQHLLGGALERDELIAIATILLVAGHETTADMISLGIFTLLRHPERMAELRERPELLPAAVDELLRFLSVADGMLRVATQDIETPSHVIRAGEGVIFSNSAMNRDDAVFDDPDVLRWNRPTRHHGAFGYGMHQCLGQNLARAEMEIALTALLNRFSELRLAVPVESISFKTGYSVQGPLELLVAWSPGS
ncbi:cytochrome P450 [Streptomyces sp. NBC_00272]|uniref:cytochrome P450 n=2 Tax=Streptomyces TaxID=1883 RepID=UPI002E2AB788|nr:cytochrome P450 [Streptomyces sp. NBC_00272]